MEKGDAFGIHYTVSQAEGILYYEVSTQELSVPGLTQANLSVMNTFPDLMMDHQLRTGNTYKTKRWDMKKLPSLQAVVCRHCSGKDNVAYFVLKTLNFIYFTTITHGYK